MFLTARFRGAGLQDIPCERMLGLDVPESLADHLIYVTNRGVHTWPVERRVCALISNRQLTLQHPKNRLPNKLHLFSDIEEVGLGHLFFQIGKVLKHPFWPR